MFWKTFFETQSTIKKGTDILNNAEERIMNHLHLLDKRIFRRRALIGAGFLTGLLIFGQPIKTYLSKQTADIANQSIQDEKFKERVSDNINTLIESPGLQEKATCLLKDIFIKTISDASVQTEIGNMFISVLKQPTVLDTMQNGLIIAGTGTVSDKDFQERIKENLTIVLNDPEFQSDCSLSLTKIVKRSLNPFA